MIILTRLGTGEKGMPHRPLHATNEVRSTDETRAASEFGPNQRRHLSEALALGQDDLLAVGAVEHLGDTSWLELDGVERPRLA
eukprot:scaffold54096_cov33-Tisochrysis_lutea.AAC.4